MQETARRVIRGVSIVVFVELVGCGGGGSGSRVCENADNFGSLELPHRSGGSD
jgi:hypothetical protein